jgi:acyl carrier protein
MIPTTWRVVAELPLNAGGKVDRAALRAACAAVRAAPPVAPRTELEARIAPIWAAVLGLEEAGVEDSFFDLGGHSLLAAALIARVGAELGVDVALRDLFDTPTVAGLARAVEAARRSGGDAAAPAIGRVPRDRHRRTLLEEDP